MYDNLSRVIEVDIDEILPNRFQPRIQFDEEEILELSDSIKEHGVIQPLVVRTIGDKYEIIAGERRYKASVLAGRETVPVIVKNLNDKDSAEIALIENIQRKNLTPIEEALSYKKILDMGYITQENLATKLGKSQSAVANKIRLLNLSDEVQEALLENKISERHARSLLKLETSNQQNEMLNRIITERLTVRKADEEIDKVKNGTSDEKNDDTQKIIEKGEIDMNNNMFGMPNVPQNPQPSFDIFGGSAPVEQPTVPQVQETTVMSQAPSFDIFGVNNAAPVQPVVNAIPEVSVAPSTPEIPTMQAMPTVEVPSTPMFNIESQPMEEVVPPVGPGLPGYVAPQPVVNATLEVPQTAPIIESPIVQNNAMNPQLDNMFSFDNTNLNTSASVQPEVSSVAEFKMPEPIIITDYTKQYDPVMPVTTETMAPIVDFKEVINAIRECSNKIEQYGFKIDVEEYDLTNLYQVIFKIEK